MTNNTFSFTLARAISSFHLCCSASSRDLLRLEMVCWSSLFSLLILSTSAGVNFWFCNCCCSSSCSCFRHSRWLTGKKMIGKQNDAYEIKSNPRVWLERDVQSYCWEYNKLNYDLIICCYNVWYILTFYAIMLPCTYQSRILAIFQAAKWQSLKSQLWLESLFCWGWACAGQLRTWICTIPKINCISCRLINSFFLMTAYSDADIIQSPQDRVTSCQRPVDWFIAHIYPCSPAHFSLPKLCFPGWL